MTGFDIFIWILIFSILVYAVVGFIAASGVKGRSIDLTDRFVVIVFWLPLLVLSTLDNKQKSNKELDK